MAAETPGDTLNLSLTERIMHSTVRLELPELSRTGTGFHFGFFKTTNTQLPAIVTNRHVVESAGSINFKMNRKGADGTVTLGKPVNFRLDNLQQRTIYHPTADLAIIPIGDVLAQSEKDGNQAFAVALDQSAIPTPEQLGELSPLETVLTVGYPGQLWDDVNNLPVFHRVSTATPPYVKFKGNKEFLVDFATWPGASGSPLFVFNESSYTTRKGLTVIGEPRVLLIGVVYGVAVQEVTGNVYIRQAPTTFAQTNLRSSSNVPTNLGACLLASQIIEFEPLLVARGITPPPGYTFREPI